jgi:hypothetical protein
LHGVPEKADPATWTSLQDHPEAQNLTRSKCCNITDTEGYEGCAFFWSTFERRYVKFHQISSWVS